MVITHGIESLKRVIAKRQAAQHAKFTADIHGE